MLEGSKVDFRSTRYNISPGDGTKYDFSIVWLGEQPYSWQVVGGVGNGADFVGLIFHGISRQGAYELRRSSLQEPHRHFIGYVLGHMGLDDSFACSISAVVLAAGVLVNDPGDLEGAADAMLRAGELAHGRGS